MLGYRKNCSIIRKDF